MIVVYTVCLHKLEYKSPKIRVSNSRMLVCRDLQKFIYWILGPKKNTKQSSPKITVKTQLLGGGVYAFRIQRLLHPSPTHKYE